MYHFDWRMATSQGLSAGMFLKKIDTGGPDPAFADWGTQTGTSNTTILASNSIPWALSTEYTYRLTFEGGQFEIEVLEGANPLASFSVLDSTFLSGDFGFYNNSQAGAEYGVSIVPEPTTGLLFGLGLAALALRMRRYDRFARRPTRRCS
jgi:hypothetical protein